MSLSVFTLPPPRSVGQPNPPGNVNSLVDALAAAGSELNVLNTATAAGGADASGSADSTAAFTAAGSGGGNVLVPPGTYLLNSSAAVALSVAGTIFVGSGKGVTIVKIGGSLSASEAFAITANFCGLRDMSIVGASSTVTSNPAANAIEVTGSPSSARSGMCSSST